MKLSRPSVFGIFYFWLMLFACSCSENRLRIELDIEKSLKPLFFGEKSLKGLSETSQVKFVNRRANIIIKGLIDTSMVAESFKIEQKNDSIHLTAGDEVGMMYALLDLKEQLREGERRIESKLEEPYLSFRAIKFNLPWSSYRNGDALDVHYETCRDTIFWYDFLNMMAENRFNKLTLWNLHPFSYMVKTDKYPEACPFSEKELETWEIFWHTLFRMAKERGIETYLVNWNIFVSPEFARTHDVALYSIDNLHIVKQGDTSEIVKDYMRESVREVIDTYPDLTGLGVTLGKWIMETVVEGARMASRRIKFIHRVPLSADKKSGGSTSVSAEKLTRQTLDTLTCFDGPIQIELKFNWSHGHSTPHLAKVHGGELADTYWNPHPKNYQLAWMIRNEDFFMLRWGQPNFIRQHIAENVHPYVNGYYLGSECYIPAFDYFTALEGTTNQYAFERQWMYYKQWGRLLYFPETEDQIFLREFSYRYPKEGEKLFNAQLKIGKVPLIIASYMNASWDFTLYSEGMLSLSGTPKKVQPITVEQLINAEPMEPSFMGVKEYLACNDSAGMVTPHMLSDSMSDFCLKALKSVDGISFESDIDLFYEIADIQAWSYLGLSFSAKLKAAIYMQKYKLSDNEGDYLQGLYWQEKTVGYWSELVQVTKKAYRPVPLMHLTHNGDGEYFHWANYLDTGFQE